MRARRSGCPRRAGAAALLLALAGLGIGWTAPTVAAQPVEPAGSVSTAGSVVVTARAFIAVQVRDVDAMASWYAGVFGLEEVRRLDAEDGRYAIRILEGGLLTVEIVSETRTEAPPERHHGLFKAGLFVRDIARVRDVLAARGVVVDEAVMNDDALGLRTFVLRDPEGNRLQLFEPCDTATCEPPAPASQSPAPRSTAPRALPVQPAGPEIR